MCLVHANVLRAEMVNGKFNKINISRAYKPFNTGPRGGGRTVWKRPQWHILRRRGYLLRGGETSKYKMLSRSRL